MAIHAQWPAPGNITAFTTERDDAVDDASLLQQLPDDVRLQRLKQVHGNVAVDSEQANGLPEADACYSRSAQLACLVVTADCLPVLLCNRAGDEIAAIHAGWRGLCSGVIEATLAELRSAPGELLAWLGPAISQAHFEVGPEVRSAFLDVPGVDSEAAAACFLPGREDRWMADLYALARLRLRAAGVQSISGGGWCTYAEPQRFHSWRREGEAAGRMACVIAFR